jgi:hypothetical protein
MTLRKLLAWITGVCPLAGMASSFLLSDFFCLSKLAPKRLDYRESFFYGMTDSVDILLKLLLIVNISYFLCVSSNEFPQYPLLSQPVLALFSLSQQQRQGESSGSSIRKGWCIPGAAILQWKNGPTRSRRSCGPEHARGVRTAHYRADVGTPLSLPTAQEGIVARSTCDHPLTAKGQ